MVVNALIEHFAESDINLGIQPQDPRSPMVIVGYEAELGKLQKVSSCWKGCVDIVDYSLTCLQTNKKEGHDIESLWEFSCVIDLQNLDISREKKWIRGYRYMIDAIKPYT